MTEQSATVEALVHLEQASAPIKFVPQRGMFDREFDISARIKFVGVIIAAAVTIATTTIFLFL